MRTYQQKTAETKHEWYIVDATGARLGILAVRIARALSGKRKPTWTPHIDDGPLRRLFTASEACTFTVVENAARGLSHSERDRPGVIAPKLVWTLARA